MSATSLDLPDASPAPAHEPVSPEGEVSPRNKERRGNAWFAVAKYLLCVMIGAASTAVLQPYLRELCEEERTKDIRELVRLEAELAGRNSPREQSAKQYRELFAGDAWIVDVRGRHFWNGREDIERRFAQLPSLRGLTHNLVAQPVLLDARTARASTTTPFGIPNEGRAHLGHEEWIFIKEDGNWKIRGFYYNLP